MRIIVNILLFLLPFAVFFTYAWFANQRRAAGGEDPLKTPWYWLIILGLLLGIAGFFAMRFMADPNEGCYVRARTGADGKVIPAHFNNDPDHPDCTGS